MDPAERFRKMTGLLAQAEKYRQRISGAGNGEERALDEALLSAALSELFEELQALDRDGTLEILQSFLDTWERQH